jgi:integrase
MAKPRQKDSGKWEIGVRHPALPGGRKYFTFDTEEEAAAYGQHWHLMKQAGLPLPAELLTPAPKASDGKTLGYVIRLWSNSGLAAPTQQSSLGSLMTEVGRVRLEDATYNWLMAYIRSLKAGSKNLSPNSIRHRVQALGRALDEFARSNPGLGIANPVRLLPKGYSAYSEVDKALALAAGKKAKVDVQRDRRLGPGEEDRIIAALSGCQREDRERPLPLKGGLALLALYMLIVNTGLRLLEAYRLKRGQVDLTAGVIRAQCSKQWRGKVKFRDVPITPALSAHLEAYMTSRPGAPDAYLFPFMEEEPNMTTRTAGARLSARFTSAFGYARCPDLREHDLRHEATCRWLEMRAPNGSWMFRSEEVNRIMGWAPNSVMAQRYASFRAEDLTQRMRDALSESVKEGRAG